MATTAIANRNFRRNGKSFKKDEKLELTAGEIAELEPVGLVTRTTGKATREDDPA
ncbi:hypothetical protein [Novosphingobium sp. ST904]|uniref:hypothetical protein n=1 Tax=Novosphingobium sp. ST904 TaxID=1684385 RepID=UPI000B1A1F0E|nr:hypothetical protein [Novosphingobium sp. ST904]TCM40103.1 hypothetical protein EDF59_105343 [Novosphingobium sp. ST904]